MQTVIHASTVEISGRAVVVRGPSGVGKSALCLELMTRGGTLVADDRTILTAAEGRVLASCPEPIAGLIEARGIGLLRVPHVSDVPVALVVELLPEPGPRLPESNHVTVLEQNIRYLGSTWTRQLAPAIVLLMTGAEMSE